MIMAIIKRIAPPPTDEYMRILMLLYDTQREECDRLREQIDMQQKYIEFLLAHQK